jgi:hypothetical protein
VFEEELPRSGDLNPPDFCLCGHLKFVEHLAPTVTEGELHLCIFDAYQTIGVGRDISVGIAIRYELRGPRIESRWGEGARFSAPFQTVPGAHPTSYTMGTESFLGVKRPGRGIDHPPPSSAEVKERVELYLYSPSGPSWPVVG